MTKDTPARTFISRIETARGRTVTIPATHVIRDTKHGYRVVPGVGRQASNAGSAQ